MSWGRIMGMVDSLKVPDRETSNDVLCIEHGMGEQLERLTYVRKDLGFGFLRVPPTKVGSTRWTGTIHLQ